MKNKKLLDFDIYDIHIHKEGNFNFLCICYDKLNIKQLKLLDYLFNTTDEINSYGYELYENTTIYCCKILIPSCYNLFVSMCKNTPEFLSVEDIKNTIIYFGDYNIVM